jgi:rRNA large subunit m3Psi methyltransferase RlmH
MGWIRGAGAEKVPVGVSYPRQSFGASFPRDTHSGACRSRAAKQRDSGTGALAFVLGGPDGHGPDLLTRADYKLSFGPMTLPHGLARILLTEQLYRATTILSGHPYHRS